ESRNELFNIINYVIIFCFAKNSEKKYIVAPILLSGVFLSSYGFYQRIILSDTHVSALMHNSNVFAGYLTGITCLTAGLALNAYLPIKNTLTEPVSNRLVDRRIYIFLLLIFLFSLASTGSIGACMSVIFGIFVFFYLRKIPIPRKYIFLTIGILAVLLILKVLEPGVPDRVIWWLTAGKMILAEPLTGIGLGVFADAYHKFKVSGLNSTFAHSYFLQTAAEIGILGFSALMVFFIKTLKPSFAPPRRASEGENIPFLIAIFAMLFHGIFDYALLIPANAILFWALLGTVSNDVTNIPIVSYPVSENKKIIFRWISVFLILTTGYMCIRIFLGSRETAIGKYYMDEKNSSIAETRIKKALQYDKYNPLAHFYLSNIYQRYFKDTGYMTYLDEAEIELKKASVLQKYNPRIYFDLYSINYTRGNKKTALYWLEKAYNASPKSVFYKESYQTFLKELYLEK
ncbi:MAG: hypothetical protein JW983_03935, partial [Elusimicrobia bacterium]|nr:hypothetical protein [Elusimicrobiota bacterium]